MNQESIIYKFLLSPRFRKWRYLALVTFFAVISLNQALVGYKDFFHLMGNDIYWITAVSIAVYIAVVFLTSKIVAKYLISGDYILLILCIFLCASFFQAIQVIVDNLYLDDYDFFSESSLIDNISAYIIYLLCISGVFIPVFLKNWLISNQQLNELKIKQESSRVEQLKEQVNPASFFRILSRSKSFVKTEPDKASDILIKFGHLLRYQLYDCNRPLVLLSSEITFVRNFLELEMLCSAGSDYELIIDGNVNMKFIPPSILLPYVQNVINTFDNEQAGRKIVVRINTLKDNITVVLRLAGTYNTFLLQKGLLKIRERLDFLYKERYSLNMLKEKPNNEIEIILILTEN